MPNHADFLADKNTSRMPTAAVTRILIQSALNLFHRHSNIMSTEIGSLPKAESDAALNAERLRGRLAQVVVLLSLLLCFETFETCYCVLRRYFKTL